MKVLNNIRISDKDIIRDIEKNENFDLDYKELKRIISLFIKFMVDNVMEGHSISIPHGLGKFRVIGKKHKNGPDDFAIDYQESKKQGKTIYHNNDHSDGFIYGFKWMTATYQIVNKRSYKFRLSKPNKDRLRKLIKEGKPFKKLYI